jgi:glycerophosphoryl diester phosphodiesterase
MLLLAHRGDHARVPENTLAAFAAAVTRPGCDGVEFDVRASADGIAVVLHDATLERVQGRAQRADSLSAAQLAATGVPTLASVLEICGPDAFLNVELKEDLGPIALDTLLAARGLPDGSLCRAVISAFEPASLATIRRLAPAVACWLNAEDLAPATLDLAVTLGCRGISADWRAINARTAAAVARAGLDLAAFTFTTRRTLARMERLGVCAACVEGAALDGDRERVRTSRAS